MPDHVHGIIWLDGTKEHDPALGQIIGAYKSITTVAWLNYHKKLGVLCSKHLLQNGFYDHIILNDKDLKLTRQYILDNPAKHDNRKKATPAFLQDRCSIDPN